MPAKSNKQNQKATSQPKNQHKTIEIKTKSTVREVYMINPQIKLLDQIGHYLS